METPVQSYLSLDLGIYLWPMELDHEVIKVYSSRFWRDKLCPLELVSVINPLTSPITLTVLHPEPED